MDKFLWKKKTALAEQLRFFGAKKQKFISVYARKPRIRVKVKRGYKVDIPRVINIDYNDIRQRHIDMQMRDLYQRQQQEMHRQAQASAQSNMYQLQGMALGGTGHGSGQLSDLTGNQGRLLGSLW